MTFKRLFILTLTLITVSVCSPNVTQQKSDNSSNPCTFSNPIAKGQDPWAIKHGDSYYFIESAGGALHISHTKSLTTLKANQQKVWSLPDDGGWNQHHLWAPELHFIQGKWYIYYAAGESGPPFTTQRSGVLESVSEDPFEGFIDKGQLYTGDNIENKSENKWSIDLTVLDLNDQLYAIWSGWEENRDTDRTPQHLYIAEMENPWTISGNRVKLSSPEEEWETGGELDLQEGPQILKNEEGGIFIMYSTRESWLPAYRLGQLKLNDQNADPMNPDNWEKSGPVFMGTEDVIGAGHASFVKSKDGTEDWIVYHTKVSEEPGWDRNIHIQPFEWDEEGDPDFGTPIPAGVNLPKPSGECE